METDWDERDKKNCQNYVFTHNNYTLENIKQWQELDCRFIQFGKEIAPTTGTPHLQGYVMLHIAKTRSAAYKYFPKGCWCKRAAGTAEQNIVYTGKDQDIYKRGDPPATAKEKGEKGAAYYDDINDKIKRGKYDELPTSFTIGQARVADYVIAKHKAKRHLEPVPQTDEPCNLWLYGETGTGKTTRAYEVAGGQDHIYEKGPDKWWCHYDDQPYVLIDDIDLSHAYMLRWLKVWCHHHPFKGESKGGGAIKLRPSVIIVTSNFSIEEIWPMRRDSEPLLRRFKQIKI